MGLLARLGFAPIVWGSKASAVQFDEPQTMDPEARAVVDLVAGGTPVCNADMNDLHPDMSSAAAEILYMRPALHWQSFFTLHMSMRRGLWEDQASQHSG